MNFMTREWDRLSACKGCGDIYGENELTKSGYCRECKPLVHLLWRIGSWFEGISG
jgi:hypothetical protein